MNSKQNHHEVNILLVEDDPDDARLVEITLDRHPTIEAKLNVATSLEQALSSLESSYYDVVLVDLGLPDCVGAQAADRILATRPAQPILVLSGNQDEALALEVIRSGAQDFLVKDQFANLPRAILYAVERRATERTLQYEASYDGLTDLANRKEFLRQVEKALAHSQRHGDMTAVIVLDLDGFKQINDLWGHATGDKALQNVASRIRSLIRTGDTAARLGGDEFAILLEGLPNRWTVSAWIKRILEKLRMPLEIDDTTLPLSASIGCAMYPSDGTCATDLMDRADLALYEAKNTGKNDFAFFERRLDQSANRRQQVHWELSDAIRQNNIQVRYHPKVCLQTGTVMGFESLCRWSPNHQHFVQASDVLEMAKAHGVMTELGHCVRRKAMKTHLKLIQETGQRFPMSINVDKDELKAPDFADRFFEDLYNLDLPNDAIKLELTESVLLSDHSISMDNLGKIFKAGISIEVDDFCASHSSLLYQSQYSIDTIKLDRTLVQDVDAEVNHSKIILETLIKLGQQLSVEILAKGIETVTQLRHLVGMGCPTGQGFLFAHPIREKHIVTWLNGPGARLRSRLNGLTGLYPSSFFHMDALLGTHAKDSKPLEYTN